MDNLRCAVIGTGHLGRFHAEKYAALPGCELVAVVDPDTERAGEIAERLGCRALADYHELLGAVDAVSIAAPTSTHHAIARDCLENGSHVLVEKPITVTLAEADELIALGREHDRLIQVGHLERFNPAVMALGDHLERPRFIESHRLAPFNPRATDVSVVLDLMIHDIDIIQDIVDSEIEEIAANGTPVLTGDIDIANARLRFANGCVANVTASRVSRKSERKMRVFQENAYLSVDFGNRVFERHFRGEGEMFPGIPEIDSEESAFDDGDALLAEIRHFTDCIRRGERPLVPGEAGRRALATAIRIGELMNPQ